MMRSLYAGVSGLQNHQTRMDVLSNNIANVNTTGFKKGRVTFQDMLSQTLTGAARPRDDKGGVNPQQVGLGMMTAAIDTIHTQGAMQVTGVNTDLAIMGEGMFILKRGDRSFYTRNGAFTIDKNGTLLNPANGFKVQGWQSVTGPDGKQNIETAATPSDIRIPVGDKDPARSTSNIQYHCNLRKTDETHQTDIEVYDNTGIARQMRATMKRMGINQWQMTVDVPQATAGSVKVDVPGNNGAGQNNVFNLTFNDNGSLISVADAQVAAGQTADTLNTGELTANVSFTYKGTGDADVNQTVKLHLGTSGLFDGITQFESISTTKAIEQDGYTMGELEGFNIDDNGQVTGVYTNGNRKLLAQVALAKFANVGGLEKAGESMYVESNNSGRANIGEAGVSGRGKMKAGTLEMSNVDLSEQFVDMIVTQRGFQANSRGITTSDQMLQEILSLKR
ncbi:MAG: flagellar hook protein FlgE [Spirochaetes bacterium]|nr:flagellar hook protein FlgE [Spirochaetota bacterium]